MKLVRITRKNDADFSGEEFEKWLEEMDTKYGRGIGVTKLCISGSATTRTMSVYVLPVRETTALGSTKAQIQKCVRSIAAVMKDADKIAAECKRKFPEVTVNW